MDIQKGDKIGYIFLLNVPIPDGNDFVDKYSLIEGTVIDVANNMNVNGSTIKTDRFYVLDTKELEENTEIMSTNMIVVKAPFLLTDETRKHAVKWIEEQNQEADKRLSTQKEDPEEDLER